MLNENQMAEILESWEDYHDSNPDSDIEDFFRQMNAELSTEDKQTLQTKIVRLLQLDDIFQKAGGNRQSEATYDLHSKEDDHFRPGMEPIPGYRLIARLGRGGFGEVWKAAGPGGYEVAVKMIGPSKNKAIEKKSLESLKQIHHPNIVPIVGVWEKNGILFIVMGLADSTLEQELVSCQKSGMRGIPFERLVRYFKEAAIALDYLNIPDTTLRPKIQHGDIKPANIFLTGGSIQLGDFSLSKSFEHTSTTHRGALTVAFSSPEILNGKITEHSDQYSLAVTWCYLRTGDLPFRGSLAQIVQSRLNAVPDLSHFSDRERSVLTRALAVNPKDRWNSCSEFVSQLETCLNNIGITDENSPPITISLEPLNLNKNFFRSLTVIATIAVVVVVVLMFKSFFTHSVKPIPKPVAVNHQNTVKADPVSPTNPNNPNNPATAMPPVSRQPVTPPAKSEDKTPKNDPVTSVPVVSDTINRQSVPLTPKQKEATHLVSEFERSLLFLSGKNKLDYHVYSNLYFKNTNLVLNRYLLEQSRNINPIIENVPGNNRGIGQVVSAAHEELGAVSILNFWCDVLLADSQYKKPPVQQSVMNMTRKMMKEEFLQNALEKSVYLYKMVMLVLLENDEEAEILEAEYKQCFPDDTDMQVEIAQVKNNGKNRPEELRLAQKKSVTDAWNTCWPVLLKETIKKQTDYCNSVKFRPVEEVQKELFQTDLKQTVTRAVYESDRVTRQFKRLTDECLKAADGKSWILVNKTLHLAGCQESHPQKNYGKKDERVVYPQNGTPADLSQSMKADLTPVANITNWNPHLKWQCCTHCRPERTFPKGCPAYKQYIEQIQTDWADTDNVSPEKLLSEWEFLIPHSEPSLYTNIKELAHQYSHEPPPNRLMILHAMMALASYGHQEDWDWIRSELKTSIWWDVRAAAAWVLPLNPSSATIDALQSARKVEPYYFIDHQIQAALERIREQQKPAVTP